MKATLLAVAFLLVAATAWTQSKLEPRTQAREWFALSQHQRDALVTGLVLGWLAKEAGVDPIRAQQAYIADGQYGLEQTREVEAWISAYLLDHASNPPPFYLVCREAIQAYWKKHKLP